MSAHSLFVRDLLEKGSKLLGMLWSLCCGMVWDFLRVHEHYSEKVVVRLEGWVCFLRQLRFLYSQM